MTKRELSKVIVRQEKEKQDLIENNKMLVKSKDSLHTQLDKAHQTIENYKEHSKYGDNIIIKNNDQIAELKSQIAAAENTLDIKDEKIAELKKCNAAQARTIEGYQNKNYSHEAEEEIAGLKERLKAKTVFSDNQAREIHILTNQLDTLARTPDKDEEKIEWLEERLKACSDDNVKLATDYTKAEERRKMAIERNVELTRQLEKQEERLNEYYKFRQGVRNQLEKIEE